MKPPRLQFNAWVMLKVSPHGHCEGRLGIVSSYLSASASLNSPLDSVNPCSERGSTKYLYYDMMLFQRLFNDGKKKHWLYYG